MGMLGGSARSEKKAIACRNNFAIGRANKKRKALEAAGNIGANGDAKKSVKSS